ncbi:hypothetical protein ACEPAI_8767 [Sanghuangporus weigelae]
MLLHTLPPEIVLNILRYCDIKTLYSAQQVNREWQELVRENENTVYRAAAIYHGFIGPSAGLTTLEDVSKSWIGITRAVGKDFKGWKDVCRRRFEVEYNWEGRGTTPKTTLLRSTGRDVHRFKLDERNLRRFVITTHRRGGLKVVCMDTDTVLFELGKHYVRHFAHCEYEKGYLIFDRFHPHSLEIWRLQDEWDGPIPSMSTIYQPDEIQLDAPRRYLEPNTSLTNPGRGSFAPWALFTPEHSPRAYRFVYPTLLVGSEWGQELYLFDVPSGTLEETIPIPMEAIPQGANGVHINYVELGARHAFVCTPLGVLILSRHQHRADSQRRQNGHAQPNGDANGDTDAPLYLDFPSADPGLRIPQLVRHYAARMIQSFGPPSNAAMREFIVTAPRVPEQSTALVRLGEDRQEFTAVHVSPDGKDFVAITIFGIAYLVRDFERVFRGEATFSEIALRINMGTSALNLAFENDRIVIQTIHGIFVFNLHTKPPYEVIRPHPHPSQLKPQPAIFPQLSAHQLLHFRNPLPLRLVSCLKMTKTAVWLDWSTRALEEVEGRVAPLPEDDEFEIDGDRMREEHPYATRMVCRIDFTPQEPSEEAQTERRYMHMQF